MVSTVLQSILNYMVLSLHNDVTWSKVIRMLVGSKSLTAITFDSGNNYGGFPTLNIMHIE